MINKCWPHTYYYHTHEMEQKESPEKYLMNYKNFKSRNGKTTDRIYILLVGHRRDLGTIFKVIFQGLFLEYNFFDIFWGSLGGLKTYSEKKRFVGQDF